MNSVVELRHTLHANPELSGVEAETARILLDFFSRLNPDKVVTGLGGHGLAFHFDGEEAGATILLRCELDALPIQERNSFEYQSRVNGVSHKCGHDGHMAILAAVGEELSLCRPPSGKVILLFQPAEEIGEGARAVIADSRYLDAAPDYSFALHNLPGFPLGHVLLGEGRFTAASKGMSVALIGSTAHAAQPETGKNPAAAMCELINQFSMLPPCLIPKGESGFVTVVGSRLGEKSFGTAPGSADVWVTLRSESNATMQSMTSYLELAVDKTAAKHGLGFDISYQEEFPATLNSGLAVDIVRRAAGAYPVSEIAAPFRWSEDFGRFMEKSCGALFGLGSGVGVPELHNHDYDFPDDLIPIGRKIFCRIIEECLALSDTV